MSKLCFHQCFGAFALVAIVCLVSGQADAALFRYYGLNETVNPSTGTTAVDATGNQNGTYAEYGAGGGMGPVVGEASADSMEYGTSATFDGVNDVVNLGAGLGQLTNNFSVAAWIKPVQMGVTQYVIADDSWAGHGWGLFIRGGTNADTNKLDFITPAMSFGILSDDAFITSEDLGQWIHVAVTATEDASDPDYCTIKMYKNGLLVGCNDEAITFAASDDNYWIGCGFGEDDGPWKGGIDEVRIYDHILSGSEVATLAGVPEPSTMLLLTIGLVCLLANAGRKRK